MIQIYPNKRSGGSSKHYYVCQVSCMLSKTIFLPKIYTRLCSQHEYNFGIYPSIANNERSIRLIVYIPHTYEHLTLLSRLNSLPI